jgi:hypothetical protein
MVTAPGVEYFSLLHHPIGKVHIFGDEFAGYSSF